MNERLGKLIGPGTTAVGLAEIVIAGIAALIGIAAVHTLTSWIAGPQAAIFMVGSMGAAAVLLFAVPHGALSQPWPVFGGQVASAVIGVAAAQWIADPGLAAGLAVGGAIAAMQALRCIHPPGGATALIAVIGGPAVHELNYGYVLLPVLANTAIIFLVAVAANYPFPWRRYPIGLAHWDEPPAPPLTSQHLQAAVRDLNVVVDITPAELDAIARSAIAHATQDNSPLQVPIGERYVHAEKGESVTIHKRIDETEESQGRGRITLNVVGKQNAGDSRD
ncbi:HPP family protein [Guyparkeria hydrothermalis]|uniref:HPP family protein n=1 Tax=Guyparkeria hydrothermalis TaxID=923 RepID=UPI002020775E|nr:HPP family protein [Guyparkeria hydrothermalis]MCL7744420.1 HPP family protein [Guyparkeria hydrothermalis]